MQKRKKEKTELLKEYLGIAREWLKETLKSRVFWMGVICLAFFAALSVRLYQIQILQGSDYYETYVSRTKRTIQTSAVRGNIYDRNGVALTQNRVVYNLTIRDLGVYAAKSGEYNEMLLRLIHLLKRFDVSIQSECPVIINEHGEYEFSGDEKAIRQFIRDIYGADKIEELAQKGEDVYSYDTQKVMERLLTLYNFNKDNWPGAETVSKEDALAICNIRYSMSATTYTKYRATTIAVDISDELAAAVLEAQEDLQGVEVEKSTVREYLDSVYFSNIIGYTAKPNADELEELQAEDGTYTATDLVGKSGLEKVYESYLAGTKGSDTVYLNNVGLILETISSTPGTNGDDIYLTIDHDLTVAAYHLLEQRLAAVLVDKLIEGDFTSDSSMLANDFKIPVKDAYFQMINNNILDFRHFGTDDATENEASINAAFEQYLSQVLDLLRAELTGDSAVARQDASEELQGYLEFIVSMLSSRSNSILVSSEINREDETYLAWTNKTISLQEYLRHAVSEGWIDSSKLSSENRYSSSEEVYQLLTEEILQRLAEDDDFAKLVYEALIDQGTVTGAQICMALIDQGVLAEESSVYESLKSGDSHTSFEYMKEKISNIEITPAQLALDPCSGSCIVVDEKTGELLALVSYPGYDLNHFSGSVDPEYWKKLTQDLSRPLYNRATQAKTAPGSTYKLVSATAGLMEGVITKDEAIDCIGVFDKVDHPMCWIYRESGGTHGPLTTTDALGKSCNFYFYEVGYRLSLNQDGEYDASLGIERLNEYSKLYGFGEKTGVEIEENVSTLTTEYPVTSAIGQGTNNFTPISLARYVTAVASSGKLYQFQLLNRVYDTDGNLVLEQEPTVERQIDIDSSIWDVLHQGMYNVTHGEGASAALFADSQVEIAGKSGTAQENKLRGSHGLFISYAPYDDPEIAMAVSIPNSYTSGNAALVSKELYNYYYGYITMDDILNNSYSSSSGSTTISD